MNRRQVVIPAVAAIAVIVLFFMLLLRPKMSQIDETRAAVESAQDGETSLRNELVRLEEARRNASRTSARLATVSQYLPSSPDLPGFIRLVQRAATQSGIDLNSIAPGLPADLPDARGVETISVTLTIEGGFRRIEDFLSRLENLERVVEVRTITLAPGQTGLSDQITLQSTLTLTMYVVQPDARPPAGAGRSAASGPTASPSPRGGAS